MKKSVRNIILLGWVSFFTDLSSQMIYPLIPNFLVGIGAGAILIGLIEGIAEASASLFKPMFGRWSDRIQNRKSFIFSGYSISTLSKPLLALATSWVAVLALRFVDRLGKAMRNPPRDAMISISAGEHQKGYWFGVQRAFDRMGSVGGPFLAVLVLLVFPENLRAVFLFAVIPAFIAVLFIPKLKDIKLNTPNIQNTGSTNNSRAFKVFLFANILFSLGNSSNAFILLRADELGFNLLMLPLFWAVYNISCAISSPLFGRWSDRIGRHFIILLSFLYYAIIYYCFGMIKDPKLLWIVIVFYGFHYGLSKGVFKAYISDISNSNQLGRSFGVFDMWTGLSLFFASLIMGIAWEYESSQFGFLIGSLFSLLALLFFWFGHKFWVTKDASIP